MAQAGSFNLALRRLSRDYAERSRASAERFADDVVAEAKKIAPVAAVAGGTYRASIRKDKKLNLGGAVAGAFGLGQGAWSFFVVSDVPYAEALEFGHSKQAPRGVFGVAIAAVRSRNGLG